jgi:hypothetical protein
MRFVAIGRDDTDKPDRRSMGLRRSEPAAVWAFFLTFRRFLITMGQPCNRGRWCAMPPPQITTPEAAIRLARAIASDLSLYNEEKIIEGIENDNVFDVLQDEIEEGRELYKSRVSPDLYDTSNYYDRAIVDIVVKSKGHIKSKIW